MEDLVLLWILELMKEKGRIERNIVEHLGVLDDYTVIVSGYTINFASIFMCK